MDISLKQQRVGVFVDVQNMYYSAKALYGQKVDFGKILEIGLADRTLVRAIAYVIKTESEQEQPFFESLKQRGLELRAKELQTFYDGNKKGDWDIGIAMDVMRMVNKLDVVVLVSGDGDFAELLKHVRALGCRAEVLAFGQSSSSLLRSEAERFVDLSEFKSSVLIPSSSKSRKQGQTQRSRESNAKRTSARDKPDTKSATPTRRTASSTRSAARTSTRSPRRTTR